MIEILMFIFCGIYTIAACWAVDRITGADKAIKLSRKWEKGEELSHIEENTDDLD